VKVLKYFILALFCSSAFAANAPLTCAVSNESQTFTCGESGVGDPLCGTGNSDDVIFASCCSPRNSGYVFGGWKIRGTNVILNIQTIFNSENMLEQMPPVIGGIQFDAQWVPSVDIDTFDVKDELVGFMLNPETNTAYYEFASGGVTLKAILSSNSTGDGVASLFGENLPTASSSAILSGAGEYCWIGVDGKKYVLVGPQSDCVMLLSEFAIAKWTASDEYNMVVPPLLSIMMGK
jgi:hypothetical protein